MQQISGLDFKIKEMAGRIRELREIEGLTMEEMAQKTDISLAEYKDCEDGQSDLTFAFIYRCALALNVDVTDIIEGKSPTLKSYTLTRNGEGQRIHRVAGAEAEHSLSATIRARSFFLLVNAAPA